MNESADKAIAEARAAAEAAEMELRAAELYVLLVEAAALWAGMFPGEARHLCERGLTSSNAFLIRAERAALAVVG